MPEPSDLLFSTPGMAAAFSPEDIDRALAPTMYLGSADAFINRALEAYREIQSPLL